ncbi:MAG: hypothetical protein MJB14_13960 [Spirochaetes bacterium]|nr:hypothetical protein [Spirochaetota bacterium]
MKRCLNKNKWPIDYQAAKKPGNWQGWPDNKQFAFIVTHDVEKLKGYQKVKKLAELDLKYNVKSCFNFVPMLYSVEHDMLNYLKESGFEIGVHGYNHDGKLFSSINIFNSRYPVINKYLNDWGSVGFYSPSTLRNMDWLHQIKMEYDSSTFDTDPFEPQPDGVKTIFPFIVKYEKDNSKSYVEIPYTLAQDHTMFNILKEKSIDIWKMKVDWIAENGGMVHVRTHPDYINFSDNYVSCEYSVNLYMELLEYIQSKYRDMYWNVLPKQLSSFWKTNYND